MLRGFAYSEQLSAIKFGLHLASIQHPLTGDTDDVEMLTLDLVFQDLEDNVTGVATLGEYCNPLFSPGQIVGQIGAAKRVPVQLVRSFRTTDQDGLAHQWYSASLEA